MKQVHPSYSFVASTKTITLTGLNIGQDQLLLIVNATRGVQYFNFADSSLRASVTSGANTSVVLTDASTTGHSNSDALVIYYEDQATGNVVSGTVTANPGTGAFTVSGTVGLDNASLVALENITVTVSPAVLGTVTISNFPATQTVAGTVTANVGNPSDIIGGGYASLFALLDDFAPNVVINGAPVVNGTLPISGTVTASNLSAELDAFDVNAQNKTFSVAAQISGQSYTNNASNVFLTNSISGTVTVGNTVTIGSLPTISGTVTANGGDFTGVPDLDPSAPPRAVNIGFLDAQTTGNFVQVDNDDIAKHFPVKVGSLPAISGTVTANVENLPLRDWDDVIDSGKIVPVKISQVGEEPVPISGTVTVGAMPNGSLTTRFGSVTTANTAQLTSAVTNTSRKYLLVQNIASATVTIGIGFAPTTTQGIQLSAGGGLTFDAFCPTGGVWWLSATTGSNFSILEG